MPKGEGFIDYQTFQTGYESLRKQTKAFTNLSKTTVLAAINEHQISLIVFRCILGFSPPEWAHVTSEQGTAKIDQGAARAIDRRARLAPLEPFSSRATKLTAQRVSAMIDAGLIILKKGAANTPPGILHRLDKADTAHGLDSLQSIAYLGAPYSVLLYERFLGRPFATHRDSVSELIGGVIEVAIKNTLADQRVPFRETKRAEKIPGFDQAPDFIIPDEFSPAAVIEAKLTEDDGTARDKVTRVAHLRTLRDRTKMKYDVIACVEGRGFQIRREDMRRLLEATEGKVFTLSTLNLLISNTRIKEYRA